MLVGCSVVMNIVFVFALLASELLSTATVVLDWVVVNSSTSRALVGEVVGPNL